MAKSSIPVIAPGNRERARTHAAAVRDNIASPMYDMRGAVTGYDAPVSSFSSGMQGNVLAAPVGYGSGRKVAPISDAYRRSARRAVEDVRDAGFLEARASGPVAPMMNNGAPPVAPMFTRPPPPSNGISAGELKAAPIPAGKFSYTTDGSGRSDWKRIGQDLADGADPNAIPAINVTGFARSSTGDGPAGMQQWNAEDHARRQWQQEQVAARGGVPLGTSMPNAGNLMAAANAKRTQASLLMAPYMNDPVAPQLVGADVQRANINNANAATNIGSGPEREAELLRQIEHLQTLLNEAQRNRALDQSDQRLTQNDQRLDQNQQRIDNAGTRSGRVGPPAPAQPSSPAQQQQPQQQQQTGQQPYTFNRRTQSTGGRVPPGATSNGDGTIVMNGAQYQRGTNAAGQTGWAKVK